MAELISSPIIFKITPSVDCWLKHLDTQLHEPTDQNLIKHPKVDKTTNKKMLLLNYGKIS